MIQIRSHGYSLIRIRVKGFSEGSEFNSSERNDLALKANFLALFLLA